MGDEETKSKRKAKDNPWYRLATLHGEPSKSDEEIAQKNRVTWNRWIAARISDELKTALRGKGWSDDELTPLSEDELRCVEARVGSSLEADKIDFQDTEFEAAFFAQGFLFPLASNFRSATFRKTAIFASTTFSGDATFDSATFSGAADFRSATFSRAATFHSATFSSAANFDSANFSGTATFLSATFSRAANFDSATFSLDFSCASR